MQINFQKKRTHVVVLLLFVAISGAFLSIYWSFLQSFDQLDRKDVRDNAQRVFRTFTERFVVIKSKVSDWGSWDEAFKYVTQRNADFAKENFTEVVISGLKITLIAYLAPDLSPIAVKKLVNGRLVDQDPRDLDFLKKDHPLISGASTEITSGIVKLDGQAAIAAAKIVAKGDGSGPPAGRVVFVRSIDEEILTALSEQTLMKVTLSSRAASFASDVALKQVINFPNGTIGLFEDVAQAKMPLLSFSGESLGVLQAEIPREIAYFGRKSASGIMSGFMLIFLGGLGAMVLVYHLSGASKDVATLLDSNRLLKQREAYLAALIDSVPGYVSWFDRSLRYIGVNQKLASDYKLTPGDFVGKEIGFQRQESAPDLKHELIEFFNDSARSKQTSIFLTRDNVRKRFLVCFEKYDGDNSAVVIGIDTTESWLVEKQAAQDRQIAIHASRLSSLGEMAAGIAHEINNPLAIIQGGCWKLNKRLTQLKCIDECRESLELIESTILRISKIVSGLRSFARDGSGDPLSVVSLETVLSELVSLCSERFKSHGVEIRRTQSKVDLQVNCRLVQLGQVLINLFNNSFDAVVELNEKWVAIEVLDAENSVEISVTDSGKGIPENVVEKIMEPFFTTKTVGKGTGLGLSISAGIIRDHGGELFYDKSSQNTRFVIRLPKVNTGSNKVA